jgi:hypothetical protein
LESVDDLDAIREAVDETQTNASFIFEPPEYKPLQAHADAGGPNAVATPYRLCARKIRRISEQVPHYYSVQGDIHEHDPRFATGVLTQISAGHRIISDDDQYLHMSQMIYESLGKTGAPGGSPLDFFPSRK